MPQNSPQSDDLHIQLSQLDKDTLVQLITQAAKENTIVRWEIMNLLRKFTVTQVASEDAACHRTTIHPPQAIASVNRKSTPQEKIALFKSLFRGRADVFALRWQNARTGKSGYSPVCKNKFVQSKCDMKKTPCASCSYREMLPLTDEFFFNHLRGVSTSCSDVIGLYPLLTDNTCYFVALDFDEADWKKDVSAMRRICAAFDIPASVEISRSGNGAHIWFFFEDAVSAKIARHFGELLLYAAMSLRHDMSFKSFDRMFPNQDTLPIGGYGNLIALPLQGRAVQENTSVFVDENFMPHLDQWAYLSSCKRITQEKLTKYIQLLAKKNSDDKMLESETANSKTSKSISIAANKFENAPQTLSANDFPAAVEIEFSNMIHIKKQGISELALGILKRLAVFHNPEFYRAQKMRLPIYNKPRYIDCSEEDEDMLSLPRGCLEKATGIILNAGVSYTETDCRNKGISIDVNFEGLLNENQYDAFSSLSFHENGILSAGTGFGKTVVAAKIIAQHKVNTLVLVHTNALLTQWQNAVKKFLNFDAGIIGSGKDNLTGKIDIAIIRSLIDSQERNNPRVKDIVKTYGMIIVDECHHVSAFSFESVLKAATAKFVYGLTATPIRRDGHEPIIFMQCGDIRYKTDARKLANEHGFAHYIVPRFMPFAIADNLATNQLSKYYEAICTNSERNKIIAEDLRTAVQDGRTPIVLSERVSHITELKELIADAATHVVLLTGQGTAKQKRDALEQLSHVPATESLVVLATGKYVGEGFDLPRLDTLFLAMPISWKGVLSQYCGRLHREYAGKTEVIIYDYIDFRIPVFERMYQKRLKGYAQLGYEPQPKPNANNSETETPALFSGNSFAQNFFADLTNARKQIIISSPYLSHEKVRQFILAAAEVIRRGVKIIVIVKNSLQGAQAETTLQAVNDSLFAENIFDSRTSTLLKQLQHAGCTIKCTPNLAQKFAVLDTQTVWYGSSNLLGFTAEDDCLMRLCDSKIGAELESVVCCGEMKVC